MEVEVSWGGKVNFLALFRGGSPGGHQLDISDNAARSGYHLLWKLHLRDFEMCGFFEEFAK